MRSPTRAATAASRVSRLRCRSCLTDSPLETDRGPATTAAAARVKLPFSALVVLVGYVVAITAFGTWLGRRRRSVRDYFLAARSVPWWAIATCIVATETSTLTFIGAPGTAYKSNWTFLQLVLGYVVGRVFIAVLFIPAYFRGD